MQRVWLLLDPCGASGIASVRRGDLPPQQIGDSAGEFVYCCLCYIVWFVNRGRSLKSGQAAFETLPLCGSEVDQRHFSPSPGWFTNWTVSILLRMSFFCHFLVWTISLIGVLAILHSLALSSFLKNQASVFLPGKFPPARFFSEQSRYWARASFGQLALHFV